MRIARNCLLTLGLLLPCLLVDTGCTSGGVDSGPPGDTTKAYKSSDEAAKDMQNNMPVLKKEKARNALPPPKI